jgi:methionyl-tRNA synthetase
MTLIQNLSINDNWLIPILIWSIAWKGVALWKCGRNNQLYWFIALLLINTVGLLEIVYLLWFQKKVKEKKRS